MNLREQIAQEIKGLCRNKTCAELAADIAIKNTLSITNFHPINYAKEIECARDWLLPGRAVTQVEIDACIKELNDIIAELKRTRN